MPGNPILVIAALIQIYSFVILARVVVSWIPNLSPHNQLVQVLHVVTEPVLEPARRVIPPIGMMDISPLAVFVGLHILQRVLLSLAA